MNWPEPSRVRGLSGWLIIATYELSAPAKERIRLEIEAHYADAVQCHLANGSTEAAAEAAALAELGDARVAAKRFRWRHFTEKEATYVEKQLHYARSIFGLLFFPAVIGFMWFTLHDGSHHILTTELVFAAVALHTVNFLVAKKIVQKSGLRLFTSLQLLQMLILGGILTMNEGLNIGLAAFVCVISWRPLWICFKTWKVKDAQQELPPQDASTA